MRHKPKQVYYRCSSSLGVREDERRIIEEMRRWAGNLGNIYERPARSGSAPQVVWTVDRQDECLALVDLFDRYPLRAKKARDYEIWREAVIYWSATRYGRKDPHRQTKMEEFQRRMAEARSYDVAA